MGKIIEFFKLKTTALAGIALALGLFLFLPEKAANQMGIMKLRNGYRSYAACAFLVTGSLVAVRGLVAAFRFVSGKYRVHAGKKAAIKRLKTLSPAEKQILCGYIVPREKTQYFSIEDGLVNGLCQAHIIASSAKLVGQPWLQSSEKARFSAKKRLEMHADIR